MPTLTEILTELIVNRGIGADEIITKAQELKNTPIPYEIALGRFNQMTAGAVEVSTVDWEKLTAYLEWSPGGLSAEYFRQFVPAMVVNAVTGKNIPLLHTAMLLALKLVK